jgi:DNA anti-recombination protein RmuC
MKVQTALPVIAILPLSIILTGLVLAQSEREAALNAMDKAQGWIKEMEGLGFPVTRANDTLNEAKLLFSKELYKGAESLANDVEGIKERAQSIDKRIDEVEASIYQSKSKGIDTSQPQALFEQSLNAFRQEDYERSEELLDQASAKLEELESDYSMKRIAEGVGLEGLLKKIQDNILLVTIIAAVLIATGIAGARVRRKRKIRSRIRKLEAKAEKLNSMMKELQLKYFEKGSVSESEYNSLMSRYRKRLAVVKRKKLTLEGLLKKTEKEKPAKGS